MVYKIIGSRPRNKRANTILFGVHKQTKSLLMSGEAGWLVVSGQGFLKGHEGWSLDRFADGGAGTSTDDVVPLHSGVILELET